MNLYLLVDPAGSKKQNSDYSVFAVIGLSPDGNYYLVDALRDRLNLTERSAALFKLHRQYRPLAVGYERYGMQADVEHIRTEQERHGYRFPIIELGGAMPKNDRIRRLIPVFEQGRFYLPSNLPFVDAEGKLRDFVQEFVNEDIERLQEELAARYGFVLTSHRMYLYGVCGDCRKGATGGGQRR